MKIKDIRVVYGRYLNLKIGEATIPPYITLCILITAVVVAYLQSTSS